MTKNEALENARRLEKEAEKHEELANRAPNKDLRDSNRQIANTNRIAADNFREMAE